MHWVDSYYLQGWLATKLEATAAEQAAWRVDPKRAGSAANVRAHALIELVTSLVWM